MKKYRKPTTPTTMQHSNPSYTTEDIVYEEIDETSGGQLSAGYLEFEVTEHSKSNPKTESGSSEEAVKSDTYLTVVQQQNTRSILHRITDQWWKIALLVCCIVILGLLSGTGYLLYVTTRYQGQPDMGDMLSDYEYKHEEISTTECENGWEKYHESCYLFSNRMGNFAEAGKFCSDINASVVAIETEEENRFLRNKIQKNSWASDYWIGLVDLANNGKWIWMGTFQPVGFEDWSSGEPNNHATENCVLLMYHFDSRWNNVQCKYEHGTFLCEKS